MQNQQIPQVLAQPFCAQGDKNTIPNAATGSNLASLQEGFPAITGLPVSQGGVPPERQDFNGIMNLNSQFYFAFQNGWLPTFSQDVSNAIGGYPQGAVLWYQTDNGLQILQSTIPNNTNNFITNPSVIGTSWVTVGATQAYVQQAIPNYFYTQITNCLTKIPQDINLVLSEGTLTLKAGSRVYVPNGPGVFDSVTLANDVSTSAIGGASASVQCVLLYSPSDNKLKAYNINSMYSGPSLVGTSVTFYDTTNNVVQRYDGGSLTISGLSFPIALITGDSTQITSIDQVFNGFGYIGSTIFVLPGVEGLCPDGRNADGTLNNIAFTVTNLKTYTYTTASAGKRI